MVKRRCLGRLGAQLSQPLLGREVSSAFHSDSQASGAERLVKITRRTSLAFEAGPARDEAFQNEPGFAALGVRLFARQAKLLDIPHVAFGSAFAAALATRLCKDAGERIWEGPWRKRQKVTSG